DERTSALCRANTNPAPLVLANRGTGTLTLRLRDVDVAEIFHALNAISPNDGFIVEPGVNGRVTVDFDRVTIAEALAEARKSAVGSGLRRHHFVRPSNLRYREEPYRRGSWRNDHDGRGGQGADERHLSAAVVRHP